MNITSETGMETIERVGDPRTIRHDLPCVTCGYNLRGLNLRGQCPECGRAVADTVPRPRVVPEAWVDRMTVGATFLLVLPLLQIMLMRGYRFTFTWPPLVELCAVITGIGVWIISRSDDSVMTTRWEWVTRWTLRVLLLLWLGSVTAAALLFPTYGLWRSSREYPLEMWITHVALPALIMLLSLLTFASAAVRIGRPRLAHWLVAVGVVSSITVAATSQLPYSVGGSVRVMLGPLFVFPLTLLTAFLMGRFIEALHAWTLLQAEVQQVVTMSDEPAPDDD